MAELRLFLWISDLAGKSLTTPLFGDFWGIWPPKCVTCSMRPPKGTSLRQNTSFEPLTAKIGSPVWPVGLSRKKHEKGKKPNFYRNRPPCISGPRNRSQPFLVCGPIWGPWLLVPILVDPGHVVWELQRVDFLAFAFESYMGYNTVKPYRANSDIYMYIYICIYDCNIWQ